MKYKVYVLYGMLQPLVVRPTENGYQLIAGERRLRAARNAGLSLVPAVVENADDNRMLLIALVENVQREDLGPIDEALAYQELMERFNRSGNCSNLVAYPPDMPGRCLVSTIPRNSWPWPIRS